MDIKRLMSQAQAMQKKAQQVQNALAQQEFTSNVGGGAFTITMSGARSVKSVKIDSALFEGETIEEAIKTLEDLIAAGVNSVLKKIEDTSQSESDKIMKGGDTNSMFNMFGG